MTYTKGIRKIFSTNVGDLERQIIATYATTASIFWPSMELSFLYFIQTRFSGNQQV
jgi:hypothetical protein